VILGALLLFAKRLRAGKPVARSLWSAAVFASYIARVQRGCRLDRPLIVRYGYYLGKLARGDLGTNFYGNEVPRAGDCYPTTIKLALIRQVLCEIVVVVMRRCGRPRGFLDNRVLVSTLFVIPSRSSSSASPS